MAEQILLSRLAELLGLTLQGDDMPVYGVNTLEKAGPGDLSFLGNPKYAHLLPQTGAGAVIVSPEHASQVKRALISQNPYPDFARAVAMFARPQGSFSGISPLAFVDESARLGAEVTVYPFAFVGPRAEIGDKSVLFPGVYVGEDCTLGPNCTLYPNAVLMAGVCMGSGCVLQAGAVLGSDGFGFVRTPAGIQKIPQVGNVQLGDRVEVGANTTVDRAALASTSIGNGTCLDNLVQVGHNVTMGKDCLIISQVGISGSTRLGDNVTLAGQVGLAGHLNIGNDVTIGPQSGVAKDIEDGLTVGGSPAVERGTYMRTLSLMPRFPEIFKRLSQLEKELAELKGKA